MRTYTFPEARPHGVGPWNNEPDKAQWVDDATGLDCLIVRNHGGALCGYVGVPEGHPAYGKDYDTVDVLVHGGLTFASLCAEGVEEGWGGLPRPRAGPDGEAVVARLRLRARR